MNTNSSILHLDQAKTVKSPTTDRDQNTTAKNMIDSTFTKNAASLNDESKQTFITIVAKWGKERITLDNLNPNTTIGDIKKIINEKTNILPKRQKLMGLTLDTSKKSAGIADKAKAMKIDDDTILMDLKVKKKSSGKSTSADSVNDGNSNIHVIRHEFTLMGTPEEKIFVDPSDMEDLPDVVEDFDLDFNAGSKEWFQHKANRDNLLKFTESTQIHIMNEPRENKPLLVLDLDHTLLDFSRKRIQAAATHELGMSTAAAMKRPFMDQFLTTVYRHYDLVVWSQTSWRWLEIKLTELGMLAHPGYRFCFVLDKTSMFSITSTKKNGKTCKHYVKPLQLIWSKFPNRWGAHNTVHLDDLKQNFALNMDSGLRVTAFHRKKGSAGRDTVLSEMGVYLTILAERADNFELVDFTKWPHVIIGCLNFFSTIAKQKK